MGKKIKEVTAEKTGQEAQGMGMVKPLEINKFARYTSEMMEGKTKLDKYKDKCCTEIVAIHKDAIKVIGESICVTDMENFEKFVAYNMVLYKEQELLGRDAVTGKNKELTPVLLERLRDAHGRGE